MSPERQRLRDVSRELGLSEGTVLVLVARVLALAARVADESTHHLGRLWPSALAPLPHHNDQEAP